MEEGCRLPLVPLVSVTCFPMLPGVCFSNQGNLGVTVCSVTAQALCSSPLGFFVLLAFSLMRTKRTCSF